MSVSDLEDSTLVLIKLSRLQKSLQEKLKKLRSLLNAAPEDKDLTIEKLHDELTLLERRLIHQQNVNANREEIVQMSLFGQEAFKASYSSEAGLDSGEHPGMKIMHNKIANKLNELKELNKRLIDKQHKSRELEVQLIDVKKRLQDVEWKNRNLYALLRHAEAASDKTNREKKAEQENERTTELKESLENSWMELKLRREIFVGLIQAAEVDWFADEQLRDLVLSLGEPVSFNTG